MIRDRSDRYVRGVNRLSCTRPVRSLLNAIQNHWLRKTLRHAARNSPFYRERFRTRGADWRSVRRIEDLPQLGFFTLPEELAEAPRNFLAVTSDRIRLVTASTGSSGQPKIIYLTQQDWKKTIQFSSWFLRSRGTGPGDVVQICFSFGKTAWMSGHYAMAIYLGSGATVIPAGNAESTATQIETIRTYGTTILVGTPSYLWRITEEGTAMTDLRSLGVHTIQTGAEPLTKHVRSLLGEAWGAEVFDSYGMMEMVVVIAAECSRQEGLHVLPLVAVEVVDPVSDRPLPRGEVGELVFTTLGRKACPLIRYRSGDLGTLLPNPTCDCRRAPTIRIGQIVGRRDDMLIIGSGESIFPDHIEESLRVLPGILGFQVIVRKKGSRDLLEVRVETNRPEEVTAERVEETMLERMPVLREEILTSETICPLVVEVLPPGSLQKDRSVKVRRVIDCRSR